MKITFLPSALIGLLFCLGANHLQAQQHSLKLYSNFLYFSDQIPRQYDYEREPFHYNGLTLAYRILTPERRVHEFELWVEPQGRSNDTVAISGIGIHTRYEYGKILNKPLTEVLDLQIGLAGRLYYLHEDVEPNQSNRFHTNYDEFGIELTAPIHLIFNVGERFYIDLNTSFLGAQVSLDYQKVNNPSIPESQQRQGGLNLNIGGNHFLRLGLGLVLN